MEKKKEKSNLISNLYADKNYFTYTANLNGKLKIKKHRSSFEIYNY